MSSEGGGLISLRRPIVPLFSLTRATSYWGIPMMSREHRLRTMYKVQVTPPTKFENVHINKRGFVIGGGPSIKDIEKETLDKLEQEVTIGVNKAYRLIKPTYLVFSDQYFWKHFGHEVQKVDCIKIIPDNIARGVRNDQLVRVRRSNSIRDVLPTSMNTISFLNNSGVGALRIAFLMGCNPIYLLGMDMGPDTSGETHFHNDYKHDPKRKTSPNRYQQFFTEFERTIKAMEERRVNVVSCSPISTLNSIIPYVPINEVLG